MIDTGDLNRLVRAKADKFVCHCALTRVSSVQLIEKSIGTRIPKKGANKKYFFSDIFFQSIFHDLQLALDLVLA